MPAKREREDHQFVYNWREANGTVTLYSTGTQGDHQQVFDKIPTTHWSFLMEGATASGAVVAKRRLEGIKHQLVEFMRCQPCACSQCKTNVRVVLDGHRLYPSIGEIGVAGFALLVTTADACGRSCGGCIPVVLLRRKLEEWWVHPGGTWWHVCPKDQIRYYLTTNRLLGFGRQDIVGPPALRVAYVVRTGAAYAVATVWHSAQTIEREGGTVWVRPSAWVCGAVSVSGEPHRGVHGVTWHSNEQEMRNAMNEAVADAHFVVHGGDSDGGWFRPTGGQLQITLLKLFTSIYGEIGGLVGLHSQHKVSRAPPASWIARSSVGVAQCAMEPSAPGVAPWLTQLVYHDVGVWPKLASKLSGSAEAPMTDLVAQHEKIPRLDREAASKFVVLTQSLCATIALERGRGLLATTLCRQSATAVPVGAAGGRPAYFYSTMSALARERGFVFTTRHRGDAADRGCVGGVYFMHPPPHAYAAFTDVIELDFKSHYPAACVACNISAETRVDPGEAPMPAAAHHAISDASLDPAGPYPFRIWPTGNRYKADGLGILPDMLHRLMVGRERLRAVARSAAAEGNSAVAASASAEAAWQKLDCCSVLGIVGSRTEMRDQTTADDVYSAARAFLAIAVNHTAAHFATCEHCECTHWFPGDASAPRARWQGTKSSEGLESSAGAVDKGPAGAACDAPVRGDRLLLMGVVTDSLRLQLSPGDAYGGNGPATGRWIATKLQVTCFSGCPPVSLELAGCYSVYFTHRDRSAFGVPMEGAADPHRWLCKGHTFNGAKATVDEVSALRAAFGIAAAVITQTDSEMLGVATSMLHTALGGMAPPQRQKMQHHIMQCLAATDANTHRLLASVWASN